MFILSKNTSEPIFSSSDPDLPEDFTLIVTSRQCPTSDFSGRGTGPDPRILTSFGVDPKKLVFIKQVHSSRTVSFSGSPWSDLPEADGLILNAPGHFGVIRTADCVPVVLVAPDQMSLALFHAGWRGTKARIVERGVEKFLVATRSDPARMIALIGPSIGACCYEVGEEVRSAFSHSNHPVEKIFQGRNLDLVGANRLQLEEAGIQTIKASGICTSCRNDLFYSYRLEKTSRRNWTVAGFGTSRSGFQGAL